MKSYTYICLIAVTLFACTVHADDDITGSLTTFGNTLGTLANAIQQPRTQPIPLDPTAEQQQMATLLNELATQLHFPHVQNAYNTMYAIIEARIGKEKKDTAKLLSQWKNDISLLNQDIKIFTQNVSSLTIEQKEAITNDLSYLKNQTLQLLATLADDAKTQDDAKLVLSLVDRFYTNGVAQQDYQQFLNNLDASNTTISSITTQMNDLITSLQVTPYDVTFTGLNSKLSLLMVTPKLTTDNYESIKSLAQTSFANDMKYPVENQADLTDEQKATITNLSTQIKNKIVSLIEKAADSAKTADDAEQVIEYIDGLYTFGVAKGEYRPFLSDMQTSDKTIEAIRAEMDDIFYEDETEEEEEELQLPQEDQNKLATFKSKLAFLYNDLMLGNTEKTIDFMSKKNPQTFVSYQDLILKNIGLISDNYKSMISQELEDFKAKIAERSNTIEDSEQYQKQVQTLINALD